MNWFSHHHEISESDLIAYHLHELPSRRERAVARALGASAALAATSAAIETTLRTLKDAPRPIDQAAFARTWAALQPALVPYAKPLTGKPRWRTPALAAATGAVLVAIGAGLFAIAHHEPAPDGNIALRSALINAAPPASEPVAPITDQPRDSPTPTSSPNGSRWALAPLTDDFRGKVGSGIYHPAQPNQPLLVHPFAFTPLTKPLQNTATQSSQPVPQAISTSPAYQTAALQPLPENLGQTLTTPASSQTAKSQHSRPLRDHVSTDVMLALGGTLIAPHSSLTAGTEPRTETATHAIAALAAFHQQFRPALGYRLALSYTRPDFNYIYGNGNGGIFGSGGIDSRIFEAAATYVVRGPHHGRLTTAADAGAALMAFLPTPDPSTSYVYRPAGVLGASAEYALGKHWSARATYRAQVFRSPDFRYTGGTIPVTTPIVLSNEPSVGIVYRFGKPVAPTAKP